jgi:Kef-type K+ transport system membrane component KefB
MLLSSYEALSLLLSLSTMLLASKIFSEIFTKLRMPGIIGQIISGVVIVQHLLATLCLIFFMAFSFIWVSQRRGVFRAYIIMLKLGLRLSYLILKQGKSIVVISFFSFKYLF